MKNIFNKVFIIIFFLFTFFVAKNVSAYNLMVDIPGLPSSSVTISAYLLGIYNFMLSIVGIVALLMLIIGGMRYISANGTSNTAAIGEAGGILKSAIGGLILALFSWLIITAINPDILYLNVPDLVDPPISTIGTPGVCVVYQSYDANTKECECTDGTIFSPIESGDLCGMQCGITGHCDPDDYLVSGSEAYGGGTSLTGSCPDGTCNSSESITSCAADCYCGNGTCDNGESSVGCPSDCNSSSSGWTPGGGGSTATKVLPSPTVVSSTTIHVGPTVANSDYRTDGTADDIQIQNAFDDIPSSGGTVYLDAATFDLVNGVKIGSNTILTGDSTAVMRFENNTVFSDYEPLIGNKTGAHDIIIHGFELDGNWFNNTSPGKGVGWYYSLIHFSGVDDVEIYDMYLHDNGYDVMFFGDCNNVIVHDSMGRNQGHEFVRTAKTTGLEVYNCDIECAVNSGIRLELTKDIYVHNNNIRSRVSSYPPGGTGYVGVYIQSYNKNYPVTNVNIYDNYIHSTNDAAIYILAYDYSTEYPTNSGANDLTSKSQSQNVSIDNNILYRTGSDSTSPGGGISMAGFDNVYITNNVIYDCEWNGITIDDNKDANVAYTGSMIYIRDNIIMNNNRNGTWYGIKNTEGSLHNIIAEYNDVYNNDGNISGPMTYANNIEIDPNFVDPSTQNFTLQPGSPCVGAGSSGSDIGLDHTFTTGPL